MVFVNLSSALGSSSSISSAGLAPTTTAVISPDESGINAGIGYSWICTDYMELGIGYNTLWRKMKKYGLQQLLLTLYQSRIL